MTKIPDKLDDLSDVLSNLTYDQMQTVAGRLNSIMRTKNQTANNMADALSQWARERKQVVNAT